MLITKEAASEKYFAEISIANSTINLFINQFHFTGLFLYPLKT